MSEKTKVFNDEYPVAIYDSSDSYEDTINQIIEEGYCTDRQDATLHPEFHQRVHAIDEMYWSDMEATVGSLCIRYFKNGAGLVCPSFGWAKRVGKTDFLDSAFEAFKAAYVNDCNIKVFLKRNKAFGIHLEVVVYHHDSPMGDHCFLLRRKYYDQFVEEHFRRKAA